MHNPACRYTAHITKVSILRTRTPNRVVGRLGVSAKDLISLLLCFCCSLVSVAWSTLPFPYNLGKAFFMLLDLARAFSFLLSILSLYWVTISAFFVPGSRWQERLVLALLHMSLAACICFFSGLLFAWPSQLSRRREPIVSTLPVQLFFWTIAGVALLFLGSWYLASYPCSINPTADCSF